ncbi:hypothetical protein [Octadecabacter ascidiaceicola]|uniref:Gram-negative bacterial tonB protein n=1 Tax=Octadecabacter ascidiaceicola TaxID=1655543 RepID=A0A238K269_9RHOB|nr:hypothetical protein [Octadecabacter ascidiaceicola]SMX36989.1 hypothetical protein OCA8868_01213 [Octadecabacter ascidiaceicola]
MRVLAAVLSVWAAGVAADHGTEEVMGDPNGANIAWAENFKAQIASCLNLGQQTNGGVAFVSVSFEMTPNARPAEYSIQLLNPTGRAGEAEGFEAARRAILRCGQPSYALPLDLFSQWRHVEISFPYFVPVSE